MKDVTKTASIQLGRMRGMNRFYHERFFADVRFVTIAVVALLVVGFSGTAEAFLLIPPITVLGAAQTAFDASYLIFSRHYATALENAINEELGATVLVASRMEESYLFPLHSKKIVAASLDRQFSWFGFMTLFYTGLGVIAFGFGLALGWSALTASGGAWMGAYLATLGLVVLITLAVGWWWFIGGVGEKRLAAAVATMSLR